MTTRYADINFWTNLEARYAIFFDLINWPWKYRPIDADRDIPTFYIHGVKPLNVEVTNAVTAADLDAQRIRLGEKDYAVGCDTLIVGRSPVMDWNAFSNAFGGTPVAGLLGEIPDVWDEEDGHSFLDLGAAKWWEPAHWGEHAGDISVWHVMGSYHHRPFGHYDGDHYCGCPSGLVESHWRKSGQTLYAISAPPRAQPHPGLL